MVGLSEYIDLRRLLMDQGNVLAAERELDIVQWTSTIHNLQVITNDYNAPIRHPISKPSASAQNSSLLVNDASHD